MCVHCYKLAADEGRHRILSMLRRGAMNVGELTDALRLSQSTVSHHLKLLADAGLVTVEANGRLRTYSLREESQCFTDCGLLEGLTT